MTDTFAENAKDALDIRLDEKGGFDELVAHAPEIVSLEVMSNKSAYIGIKCADGRYVQLWLHSKSTIKYEFDAPLPPQPEDV